MIRSFIFHSLFCYGNSQYGPFNGNNSLRLSYDHEGIKIRHHRTRMCGENLQQICTASHILYIPCKD